MKNILIVLCLSSVTFACNKGAQKVEAPCMRDRIDLFQDSDICETGASVKEYTFQKDLVYVFDTGNCIADGTQDVYDYNCNLIGFLGGIAGNDEINGKNFYKKATLERTLFEN